MRILVISADEDLVEDIRYSFGKDGAVIRDCDRLSQATLEVSRFQPDFCLLANSLPDGSALDFMRSLGASTRIPVIVLGEDPSPKEVVLCLEYGCIDYMRYPIDLLELKARMRLALRLLEESREAERKREEAMIKRVGGLQFNPIRHEVYTKDGPLGLTLKEFEIFYTLMQERDKLMSREELTQAVWEDDKRTHIRTIDVYIRRLRTKLKRAGIDRCIETKWGKGYTFRLIDDRKE